MRDKEPTGTTVEQAVWRAANAVVVFAGLFHVLTLWVGKVQFDYGFVHFSSTGRVRSLVALVLLYAARTAFLLARQRPLGLAPLRVLRRDLPAAVFLASLTLFAALSSQRLVNLQSPPEAEATFLTGDEPTYLLMSQSIVLDRDVNLWNDARRRGVTFHCTKVGPHKAAVDPERQRVYSVHSPGLPLLLAPFHALALKTGLPVRFACVAALNALAAALCVLLYFFSLRLSGNAWTSAVAVLLTAASSPLLVYASQIFPEMPATFLVLAGYYLLLGPAPAGRARQAWQGFLVGACMAYLPWLHIRMGVFSASLFVSLLVTRRKQPLCIAASCLPAAVSAAVLMTFYHRWYGSPWPNAAYAAQGTLGAFNLDPLAVLRHFLGLFLDNGIGLLPWSPWLLFFPAGLVLAWRRDRRTALLMLTPLVLYLLVVSAFQDWFGGYCPPNRFILAVVPFLAAWSACFLARNRKALAFVAVALLAAAGIYFLSRAVVVRYLVLYTKRHVLQSLPLPGCEFLTADFTHSILRKSPLGLYQGLLRLAVILLANILVLLPGRHPTGDPGGRTP